MVYPSIRSYVVIQFCVCFFPSVCLPVRILSYMCPSVCPSVRLYAYFCVILFVTLLVFMFSFRSFVRPNVRPSCRMGWSGDAMVLGKLQVPGCPTYLDKSRARACCAYSRCGWGLFGHFFFHLSFLFSFSPSLWEMARYRLTYCLKGPLSPKQLNNQPSCLPPSE